MLINMHTVDTTTVVCHHKTIMLIMDMGNRMEIIPSKWVINPQNTMQVVVIKITGNANNFMTKVKNIKQFHFYISVHLHTQLMIQDTQITHKITVNHMAHQQNMELLLQTLPIQQDNTTDLTEIMVSTKVLKLLKYFYNK